MIERLALFWVSGSPADRVSSGEEVTSHGSGWERETFGTSICWGFDFELHFAIYKRETVISFSSIYLISLCFFILIFYVFTLFVVKRIRNLPGTSILNPNLMSQFFVICENILPSQRPFFFYF